jgi:transcriptional activator of cad operon
MERPTATTLRIGAWCVHPASGQISREGETARVEARTMRLLLCLAEHAGEVVSIDDLLTKVWSEVSVSPDSVYQAVASLRRLLGDDPRQPTYIATVPRLGYRMVATVSPWTDRFGEQGPIADRSFADRPIADHVMKDQTIAHAGSARDSDNDHPAPAVSLAPTLARRPRTGLRWAVGGAISLAVVLVVVLPFHRRVANTIQSASFVNAMQAQKSVAVLPFLDLTQGMKEEEFADGMTEELIDKLSKIPGLHVPPPTASFYFKGKPITIAEIAKTLSVAYVLDGSVRRSGARLRVAARLIRADNGYVVWSETYDRTVDDILMVQDDIAGEVTKALRASIEARPER